MAGGFLILTYYAVIAGMTLDYAAMSVVEGFANVDAAAARGRFADLAADPWRLAGGQAAFLAATVAIVARGVGGGIEWACTWLMPILFAILLLIAVYGSLGAASDRRHRSSSRRVSKASRRGRRSRRSASASSRSASASA